MPRFGEFETIGAAVEVTHERGHVATVWQARKGARGENRLFAIKVYSARQASSQATAAEEGLNGQRHRAFLEGVKQLQKAGLKGKNRRLTPIYDFGFSDEGAWYATDFYARGSLKAWILRLGGLDGPTLEHILHEVIAGCLALKQARGHFHGNLKPANVFLTGKPRPLRKTWLVLGDPYPAAPLKLAQLDFANRTATGDLLQPVGEAQDVRALGELILQLVEGRLLRSAYDYNYPIANSDSWEKLGNDGEYWRQMCNRLLDPQLSLETANLMMLEQELRPKASAGRLPDMLAGAALVCLLVVGGVLAVKHFKNPPQGIETKPTEMADKELQAAQTEFDKGNYQAVLAVCAKHPNDTRFASLHSSASAEQQQLQHSQKSFAIGDYTFSERLRPQKFSSKPPFVSLLKQADDERELLASLWSMTNSILELKRRLSDTNIAQIEKPPFDQLRNWVNDQASIETTRTNDVARAQSLFEQGKYDEVLAICAKYPNEPRFTTLLNSTTTEQRELQEWEQRFSNGDYSFIEKLRAQRFNSKPQFAALLKQADAERQLLAKLRALTNSLPELQKALAEPPVARITKPPFQELRKWALEESARKALAQDIQTAQDQLAQGSYTKVLEICAQHTNAPPFGELAATASAEQKALSAASARFDQGDYSFVDSLRKEPFSSKTPFARLLTEATNERALLEKLQALKQSGELAQLSAEMAKAEVGIKKRPFEDLRWLVFKNQELVKELRKHQARLGTLPRGEPPPLDEDGKPVVRLGRTRPVTIYLAPLRQLKQQFQQINQLTPQREKEFEQLDKAIFDWNN